jgi:hypothetical protein
MKYFFKDGKEFKGGTHKMPNGEIHSNKTHTKSSKKLFKLSELSDKAKKRAKSNAS